MPLSLTCLPLLVVSSVGWWWFHYYPMPYYYCCVCVLLIVIWLQCYHCWWAITLLLVTELLLLVVDTLRFGHLFVGSWWGDCIVRFPLPLFTVIVVIVVVDGCIVLIFRLNSDSVFWWLFPVWKSETWLDIVVIVVGYYCLFVGSGWWVGRWAWADRIWWGWAGGPKNYTLPLPLKKPMSISLLSPSPSWEKELTDRNCLPHCTVKRVWQPLCAFLGNMCPFPNLPCHRGSACNPPHLPPPLPHPQDHQEIPN